MELVIPQVNWAVMAPMLVVAVSALSVLVVDLFLPKERRGLLAGISLLGLAFAFMVSVRLWGREEQAFKGMVALDPLALFFDLVFLLVAALTILISPEYLKREEAHYGEYYVLILFATLGMMLMASGLDLIVIFLGLETLSLSLFILSGFLRGRLSSNESALKYLLLGAFATSFFLYGIALLYGSTGTTNLPRIGKLLQGVLTGTDPLLFLSMGLLMVGLGFKIATVPFHAWIPDVYEGAPTSVTAFMIAGTKAATFAAFLRIFPYALSSLQADWTRILAALAVLTMTVGNVMAIAQQNVKRMLAYSSIAHAGYLMVALVAAGEPSIGELAAPSLLFYLVVYAFMNLGAFGVIIALGKKGEMNLTFDDYAGLGFRHPALALAMAVFMFSLAGLPPTAGFIGKFYLFTAAVQAGYVGLAIIGVLNGVLSVYFYLRLVVAMYMSLGEVEPTQLTLSPALAAAITLSAVMTLYLGLFPGWLFDRASTAVLAFVG
ncbi:MAG: NADH-quinone oxidoreductase subunit N [candidate division NC10 bacterium]|nr:NADH-quinone oxidoreductase subunit N [candidate division NC10 bacterium]